MPVLDPSELAEPVREIRHRLRLSQVKFAASLRGYLFALKPIEHLPHQMGDSGKDLLAKSFSV
jgi:putative transcriptional regulator